MESFGLQRPSSVLVPSCIQQNNRIAQEGDMRWRWTKYRYHQSSFKSTANYLVMVVFLRISLAQSCMNYCWMSLVFIFSAFAFYFFSSLVLASSAARRDGPVWVFSLLNLESIIDLDDTPFDTGLLVGGLTFWYSRIGTRGVQRRLSYAVCSVQQLGFSYSRMLDLMLGNCSSESQIMLWESLCLRSSSYLLIWLSSSLMPERSQLQSSSDLVLERYSWYMEGGLFFTVLPPRVGFIPINKILLQLMQAKAAPPVPYHSSLKLLSFIVIVLFAGCAYLFKE